MSEPNGQNSLRLNKPGLTESLLRNEWVVACLEGIAATGLAQPELHEILDIFLADQGAISAANQVRRNGVEHTDDESLTKALACGHASPEEKSQWLARNPRMESEKVEPKVGFVYLMRNARNGLTKIGFSRQPKFREATLQSEEPEIALIFTRPGPASDEAKLHDEFSEKRIRGEWFDLSKWDIESIKSRASI